MINELQMCQDSYSEMLEMYLKQIFIKLKRHFKSSINADNSRAAEEIDKAISYFSEHYNEPISIDAVSYTHLSKSDVFKNNIYNPDIIAYYSQSPLKYVTLLFK